VIFEKKKNSSRKAIAKGIYIFFAKNERIISTLFSFFFLLALFSHLANSRELKNKK
jgi:hypothetical protein